MRASHREANEQRSSKKCFENSSSSRRRRGRMLRNNLGFSFIFTKNSQLICKESRIWQLHTNHDIEGEEKLCFLFTLRKWKLV